MSLSAPYSVPNRMSSFTSVLLLTVLSGQALAASSEASAPLLLGLFYIVLSAAVLGTVFTRLKLPGVVGQVLAGVIIGPSVLGLVGPGEFYTVLSELGAIFLLFMVGLETRLKDLLAVGKEALTVALIGIALPFGLGYAFGVFQNYETVSSLFIGTALVATSVGITAKVLQELGVLDKTYAQVILGAAVIDDILGLTILAVVGGLGESGSFSTAALLTTLALSVGFVLLVVILGLPVIRRLEPRLRQISLSRAFNFAVVVGLGLAALSIKAGLAPIIGAFLAGMLLAEVKDKVQFEDKIHALEAFLAPVFFVVVGLQLNLSLLASPTVLIGGAVLSLLAVLGKYLGGVLGAKSLGRAQARVVGMGMVPRGEVGLIVASLGLSSGLVTGTVYAEVILMVIVTTVVAPLLLRPLVLKATKAEQLN